MQMSKGDEAANSGVTAAPTDANGRELVLLTRIALQRDAGALERLYQVYRPRLGAFLFRLVQDEALCEEIFNDVMLAVWRQAGDFNGKSKVSTWVFAIAYRQGLSRLRSRREFTELDEDMPEGRERQEEFERQQLLGKAILALSPEHRLAIELAYYQGLNYREISEIAGCPENTVKTRIFNARRKLREQIDRIGAPTSAPAGEAGP